MIAVLVSIAVGATWTSPVTANENLLSSDFFGDLHRLGSLCETPENFVFPLFGRGFLTRRLLSESNPQAVRFQQTAH
jgi:hypothetical protein